MSVTFTPAQIEQFKRLAKHISRETNTFHCEALDQIARENGFNNWSLLIKHVAPVEETQHPPAIAGKAALVNTPAAQASVSSTVDRLVAIGFKQAGRWLLTNQVLRLELKPTVMHEQNVLYAFVVDNALMYIGKTTQSLIKRMQGYRSPASNVEQGGSTNIKNNRNIINALAKGANVHIYVLHNLPVQHHGEFPLNLAAGLEDSLISSLTPLWNRTALSTKRPLLPPGAAVEARTRAPTTLEHNSGQIPSVETLLAFCHAKRGEMMTTLVRKSPFRIEVAGDYLAITPGSSQAPRLERKSSIGSLLDRLAQTQSFQMSDYQDVTFNASYVLSIVKAWQRETVLPIEG